MSYVVFEGAEKIYGPKPEIARALMHQGLSKTDIRERSGHTVALAGVNLAIEPQAFYVIMGRSGSGKSTLLRAINRLVSLSAGTVRIDGQDPSVLSEPALRAFRQKTVSMVFQNFGLLPHLNVRDNIAFPLSLNGIAAAAAADKAEAWLTRVGLAGYGDGRLGALSSGMRQRVGLARALITETPLLLMDEPFAALDPLTRREMQDDVLRLKAEFNKTVIMISHDPIEAARLATQVAVLRDGRLAQTGTWDQLCGAPADDEVAAFVSAAAKSTS
jgi:glycine betaine/proline transport system ATP-binding protein